MKLYIKKRETRMRNSSSHVLYVVHSYDVVPVNPCVVVNLCVTVPSLSFPPQGVVRVYYRPRPSRLVDYTPLVQLTPGMDYLK
mmetsp:Transcript_42129/g.47946  ORF Transcript_42129/g.47946 Transcript_42129/m.47946 type:complete len:83 (+) Transcript_42129:241-489(+)